VWRRIRNSPDWHYLAVILPLMILLQVIGPEYFRFERDWMASGEIWRLISAHWVHVGWMHLLLNGLGLVICVILTTPGWPFKRWVITSLLMGLGISLLVTFYNPEIKDYAGHSGVLYGLYVLGGGIVVRARSTNRDLGNRRHRDQDIAGTVCPFRFHHRRFDRRACDRRRPPLRLADVDCNCADMV